MTTFLSYGGIENGFKRRGQCIFLGSNVIGKPMDSGCICLGAKVSDFFRCTYIYIEQTRRYIPRFGNHCCVLNHTNPHQTCVMLRG